MCISVKLYSHSMYTPGYFWYHHIQKILSDRGSCIRVYIHIKQRRVIFFFLLFSSELISSTYLNNLLLPILIAGSQRLWINLPLPPLPHNDTLSAFSLPNLWCHQSVLTSFFAHPLSLVIDASLQDISVEFLGPDDMAKVLTFHFLFTINCFSVPISSMTDSFVLYNIMCSVHLEYIVSKDTSLLISMAYSVPNFAAIQCKWQH